jgi:hypothetical protein
MTSPQLKTLETLSPERLTEEVARCLALIDLLDNRCRALERLVPETSRPCRRCGGTGLVHHGSGVSMTQWSGPQRGLRMEIEECLTCLGTGRVMPAKVEEDE